MSDNDTIEVRFSGLEEYELTASALYECSLCAAIVRLTDVHAEWHRKMTS